MLLLILGRALAQTEEGPETDEFTWSFLYPSTLQVTIRSTHSASSPHPTTPITRTAGRTDSPLPSAAPPAAAGLDPVRAILLVLFSIILVTILGIMAAYCYKRLRQRNAEDDDRLEEPLLIPSEEF
jgi:hypothetical protein